MNKKVLFTALAAVAFIANVHGARMEVYENAEYVSLGEMQNPSGSLNAVLGQKEGKTLLVLTAEGKELTNITLGISAKGKDFSEGLQLQSVLPEYGIVESYSKLHGKCSVARNEANSLTARFVNRGGERMEVEIRLYNDGLAFRYHIPNVGNDTLLFLSEHTSYCISKDAKRWLQRYVTSYEEDFSQRQAETSGEWGYPALFETGNSWMLITEANSNRMYCNTHLDNSAQTDTYSLAYPHGGEGNGIGDVCPVWVGAWTSPWRIVIAGAQNTLVQSTLVEDVSAPCALTDLEFIKPGRASWIYWAYNHGTKDYQLCCQYVDLAASMGWEYVLFDWEWDSMENGGNLKDAAAYALSRGVKPLIWYNSGGSHNNVEATPRDRMLTHENRMEEFAWLKSIGIVGVKIDFFESDKQQMLNYYLDILEDAAEAKMLVNFHGATLPRGWSRTYPHLMSMEAVYGAEQYNNSPNMTRIAARLNCTLPFTRNVVGPMDYTPVAFTDSQHPHTTTYAHELALSVVFESGIQHWADRPEGFYSLPAKAWQHMAEVPVVWDETLLVEGYPGTHIVMARRNESNWYVAGLNGEKAAKTFRASLSFLPKGKKYNATVFSDGAEARQIVVSDTIVTANDVLTFDCLPEGGFLIDLKE